jgi:hypothetical protein
MQFKDNRDVRIRIDHDPIMKLLRMFTIGEEGRTASNPHVRFLCYCSDLEGLIRSIGFHREEHFNGFFPPTLVRGVGGEKFVLEQTLMISLPSNGHPATQITQQSYQSGQLRSPENSVPIVAN